MLEEQAFSAIKNALRLENLSRESASRVAAELAQIFRQIRLMVREWPKEDVARQLRYRQLELQIADMFRGVNARFYSDLTAELRKEVEIQVDWAERYLKIAEAPGGTASGDQVLQPCGKDLYQKWEWRGGR